METQEDIIVRNNPEYKMAMEHIKELEAENKKLKNRLNVLIVSMLKTLEAAREHLNDMED